MSSEQRLLHHLRRTIGRTLGVEVAEVGLSRIVATLDLDTRHLALSGAVLPGVLVAIADAASTLAAGINAPSERLTLAIDSKSSFLEAGQGRRLTAETVPLHVGHATSVWRTQCYRGESNGEHILVAEVTQTHLVTSGSDDERALAAPDDSTADVKSAGTDGDTVVPIADVRKQQILEGACSVMLKKGFGKTSVREIAEACDMPIPTMYKYVRSKEDILLLIYENFLSAFERRLNSLTQTARPPREQFEAVLQATLSVFDEYHEHLKLIFRETKSLNEEGRRRVYALDRAFLKKYTALIAELGADRRLGIDAELLANFVYYLTTVWGMRHWAMGQWSFETVSDAMNRFLSAALLNDRSSGAAAKRKK